MRLRLSRLDGTEIQAFHWSIEGLSVNDMRAATVPEQAELLTGVGEEILRYDVHDLIRDTGFQLRVTATRAIREGQ
jgi:hypothetical protein